MLDAIRQSEIACSKQHGPLLRGLLTGIIIWTVFLQIYLTYRGVNTDQKELLVLPAILMVTGIILPAIAIAKIKKDEDPDWPHL